MLTSFALAFTHTCTLIYCVDCFSNVDMITYIFRSSVMFSNDKISARSQIREFDRVQQTLLESIFEIRDALPYVRQFVKERRMKTLNMKKSNREVHFSDVFQVLEI